MQPTPSRVRAALLAALFASLCGQLSAQTPKLPPAPEAPPDLTVNATSEIASAPADPPPALSASPAATPVLLAKVAPTPAEKEASRIAALGTVNGRPYDQPSHKDQFYDYLRDSYGLQAFTRSTIRATYGEIRGKPEGWGQDFPGYAQRYGSAVAVTAINGNVRYAMETIFQEDMTYIPCHGCSAKRKIGNAVLSEFTARHNTDGHRFFTLTPVIADFSGPIIANAFWYPNHDPFGGVVATRTVFVTRVAQHLFWEFVWERRHKDVKLGDDQSLRTPGKP